MGKIVLTFIIMIFPTLGFCTEETIDDSKPKHGFLYKTWQKTFSTSKGNVEMNDLYFDEKFKPLEIGNNTNLSVGRFEIEKPYKEGKIGKYTGTGTIINTDGNEAEILTVKHNFSDKKNKIHVNGTFQQGYSRINENKEDVDYLASYDIYKVCVHSNRDLAIAYGKKKESKLSPQSLSKIKSSVTDTEKKDTYSGVMYGYPLGVKDQRKSNGKIYEDGSHEIESLGGMSGAGIFNKKTNDIHNVHTGATGEYQDPSLYYISKRFDKTIPLHFYEKNMSEPVNKSLLNQINTCYNKLI